MKKLLLLLLISAGLDTASAQEVIGPLESPDFKYPKNEFFFKEDTNYLVIVEYKTKEEAGTAARSLHLTKAPKNPNDEDQWIKAEVNDDNTSQLKLTIAKADLKGMDTIYFDLYLGKDLKFTFKMVKTTVGQPAVTNAKENNAALFPDKVTDGLIQALKGLTYASNNEVKSDDITTSVNKDVKYLWNPATSILKTKDDKKFLHVGDQFYFQILPVPNPYKYTVKIYYDYKDHNDSTDTMLGDLLLNPVKLLGSVRSLSSSSGTGTEDKTIKDRKNKALAYLQEGNAAMIKFLDHYRSQEVINPDLFNSDKSTLLQKLNETLKNADIGYNGDIEDYVSMIFEPADTIYIKKLVTNYRALRAYEVPNNWISMGQVQNFDELTYLVDIRSRLGKVTGLKLDTVQRFTFPIRNGFKVDVSPGLFYTGLSQPVYSLNRDSVMGKTAKGADTVLSRSKSILKEKGSNGQVGFSTLIHFYWRWGTSFNVAASIGAGLTLMDKPQVRYFGGISFLAGRINRLALTLGYTGGRIEELSDRYRNDDGSFKLVNNNETALSTKKVLKGDFFISLGYNFPLLKRKP